MSTSPLFKNRTRSDRSYAGDEESTWTFLERVQDQGFDRVRRAMNAWFGRYPADRADDLRGRLDGGDNIEFHSAWFELYLHELHCQLCYDVVVEPAMSGTDKRPDFLVSRDGSAFFLEATVVGHARTASRTRRIAQVTAAINRICSPDFALGVEIENEGRDSPPMREVRRRIEWWLTTLDWHVIRSAQERGFDDRAFPVMTADVGDWSFIIRALPRRPEDRDAPDARTIHFYPSEGGVFDDPGALRRRLQQKADKYRASALPLIIAVRLDRFGADADDINEALMGPSIGRHDPADPYKTLPTGRHGTGFFRYASGYWRNRHVSAVLVWDQELRPWSIARRAPTLWLHPEPERALPSDLPWSCVRIGTDTRVEAGSFVPGLVPELPEIKQFVDPAEWPGELFSSRHRARAE